MWVSQVEVVKLLFGANYQLSFASYCQKCFILKSKRHVRCCQLELENIYNYFALVYAAKLSSVQQGTSFIFIWKSL